MFPQAEFEAFATKLHSQPLTARPTRDFARMFVAGASSETADSQGRVVILGPCASTPASKDDGPARPDPPGRDLGQGGVGAVPGGRHGRLQQGRDQRRPPGRAGDLVLTAARHQPVMVDRVTGTLRPRPARPLSTPPLASAATANACWASAPDGRVIGLDRDPEALALARQRLAWAGDRLVTVAASFEDLGEVAARLGVDAVDEVLYDLGVSSLQLDEGDRGFQLPGRRPPGHADGPHHRHLRGRGGAYPRPELARILREYGEERFASRIARVLDEARRRGPITTTGQLAELVEAAVLAARRTGPTRPAGPPRPCALRSARAGRPRASLPQAIDLLAPGGRRRARLPLPRGPHRQAGPGRRGRPAGRPRRRTASPSTRRPPRPPPWRC